jgi:hypothetical protein
MAWTLAVVFAVMAVILAAIHWIALRENRYLTALLVQVLLDEDTHKRFQDGLHNLIMEMQAKNASDLYTQVSLSLSKPASHSTGELSLASSGLLWRLKQRGGQ